MIPLAFCLFLRFLLWGLSRASGPVWSPRRQRRRPLPHVMASYSYISDRRFVPCLGVGTSGLLFFSNLRALSKRLAKEDFRARDRENGRGSQSPSELSSAQFVHRRVRKTLKYGSRSWAAPNRIQLNRGPLFLTLANLCVCWRLRYLFLFVRKDL